MDESAYDPILVSFLSTLGDRLQTQSQVEVIGGILAQVARIIYGNDTSPIDIRTLITQGLNDHEARIRMPRQQGLT